MPLGFSGLVELGHGAGRGYYDTALAGSETAFDFTAALPAGVAAGDLLVYLNTRQANFPSGDTGSVNAPTGWAGGFSLSDLIGTGFETFTQASLLYRVATGGSDDHPVVTATGSGPARLAASGHIFGYHTAVPLSGWGTPLGSGTIPTTGGITNDTTVGPWSKDALVISVAANRTLLSQPTLVNTNGFTLDYTSNALSSPSPTQALFAPVNVAATSNVDLTSSTVVPIDGVLPSPGDSVWLPHQTATPDNGIYLYPPTFTVGPTTFLSLPWIRRPDTLPVTNLNRCIFDITAGVTNVGKRFQQTNLIAGTVAPSFQQVGALPTWGALSTAIAGVPAGTTVHLPRWDVNQGSGRHAGWIAFPIVISAPMATTGLWVGPAVIGSTARFN